MTFEWQEQLRPGAALQEIVQQATAALIVMDAERLEELARCCADLNRDIEDAGTLREAARDLRDCAGDLKILDRVLCETRANLTVLSRLHVLRIEDTVTLQGGRYQGRTAFDPPAMGVWEFRERKPEYGDN